LQTFDLIIPFIFVNNLFDDKNKFQRYEILLPPVWTERHTLTEHLFVHGDNIWEQAV